MAVEALGTACNRGTHRGVLVGLAVAKTDILGDLRQRIEAMANRRNRLAELFDYRHHLQGSDEAVARRGVVRQDDVAGRLPTKIVAMLAHLLENVTVADLNAQQLDSLRIEMTLQAEIRHDGGDDPGLRKPPFLVPALRNDGEQLIAIDQMAVLVG